MRRGAKHDVKEKIFYFGGLSPFEDDFYVPTNSELSISTRNHEEANLVCFMNFVNPNFARKQP
jgi:hypothetical protein